MFILVMIIICSSVKPDWVRTNPKHSIEKPKTENREERTGEKRKKRKRTLVIPS
jgi:hypothetical protein